MGLFDDDICWCGDSNRCDKKECIRHMSNRTPQPEPDLYTCAQFMGTKDCPYLKEYENDEEETYVITPWGCLYAVLLDYGIDVSHVRGRVGEHIIEDFMEAMEKAGYIAKGKSE